MSSINILYTPNINDIKRYNNRANPNNIIVSSYMNTGSYIGYDHYKGLSYELYYIDNDRKVHQLSYNLVEGNGISIRNNKFNINIDNDTLIGYYHNYEKNYIVANTNALKSASPLNRGILYVDSNLYYNDLYRETIVDDDAIRLNNTNDIIMASGLVQELAKISLYNKKCNNIVNDIKALIKALKYSHKYNVNVGDILYYDQLKQEYVLEPESDGIPNIPKMICVIASNILPDNAPRFIPLNRSNTLYQYDDNKFIQVKNALSQVPIYATNDVDNIDNSTKIIGSSYGFIATDRSDWKNNVTNPFNSNEHYYANINKIVVYEGDELIPVEYADDAQINLAWYLDGNKIDFNDNYALKEGAIYSNVIDIDEISKNKDAYDRIMSLRIYILISVIYNKVTKYYMCNLSYNEILQRFVNINKTLAYCIKKTTTNNFDSLKDNSEEEYNKIFDEDLNEYIKTIKIYDKIGIHYITLEDCEEDFTNIQEPYIDDTFIITNKQIELTDISVSINDIEYYENKYKFNILSSVDGYVNISVSSGSIDRNSLMVSANKNTETITITNYSKNVITCNITVTLTPSDKNSYKSLTIYETKLINGDQ